MSTTTLDQPTTQNGNTMGETFLTFDSSDLQRALHNASLFTANDKGARPILESVELKATAGTTLATFVATDSYGLLRQEVFATGPDKLDDGTAPITRDVCVLIPRADAMRIAKLRGDDARELGVVGIAPNPRDAYGQTVTFYGYQSVPRHVVLSVPGEFPNYGTLRPPLEDDRPGTQRFGIAPFQLSRLAKVLDDNGGRGKDGAPCRFSLTDGLKPIVVSIGADVECWIMPVRVA